MSSNPFLFAPIPRVDGTQGIVARFASNPIIGSGAQNSGDLTRSDFGINRPGPAADEDAIAHYSACAMVTTNDFRWHGRSVMLAYSIAAQVESRRSLGQNLTPVIAIRDVQVADTGNTPATPPNPTGGTPLTITDWRLWHPGGELTPETGNNSWTSNGWTYTAKAQGAVEVQTRVERNSADNGTVFRIFAVGWYASLRLLTTSAIRGHCSARLQLSPPSVGIPTMGLMPNLS